MSDETNALEELHSRIADLIGKELWGQAASEIARLPSADAAEVVSRCDKHTAAAIFNFLPDSAKPDIASYLEPEAAADIMRDMPSDEAADILEEMDPDDSADVLAEFDKSRSSQVIEQMDDDEAEDVRRLMTYPDDTAGGIMTTDLVALSQDATVLDALDAIASEDPDAQLHQVYVTDADKRLVGIVTIVTLIHQKKRDIRLRDIMEQDFVFVPSNMDQEEVARTLSKYSLSVLPVVDADGVLLGRVTHDDAIEVIQEEAEEDFFRLAGSKDEELGNISAVKSCRMRLPWLGITFLGGIFSSLVLNDFTHRFNSVVVLTAFIPNAMAMGGNTGLQSSVLLIRELASGSNRRHSPMKMFIHEIRTGALMGLICGAGIFAWALLLQHITASASGSAFALQEVVEHGASATSPIYIAMVVAVALFSAMSFAAGFGAVVPLAFKSLKIDPAVASGPMISVINDISALLIYYAITYVLLSRNFI